MGALLVTGIALGCASHDDEARSGGLAGASASAADGGSPNAGVTNDGGRMNAGGDFARAGTTALAGASGSATGHAGAAGAFSGSGGAGGSGASSSGGASASCQEPVAAGDQSHLTASEQDESYAVTGTTADQLRLSINQNRPGDYDALTTWNIAWSFQNCTNPQWLVSLDVVYDLPRWDAPTSADSALVARWHRYLDALYCHEYGHGKLGLDCANSAYAALAALQPSGDCDALTAMATATFQGILDDCKAREVQYDADTMHGATMGAIFP